MLYHLTLSHSQILWTESHKSDYELRKYSYSTDWPQCVFLGSRESIGISTITASRARLGCLEECILKDEGDLFNMMNYKMEKIFSRVYILFLSTYPAKTMNFSWSWRDAISVARRSGSFPLLTTFFLHNLFVKIKFYETLTRKGTAIFV